MATSLRNETAALVDLAKRDLDRLWRVVAGGASAATVLHDLLPSIVVEYGTVGSAMAAEWYDEQRERAAVKGRFTAVPLTPSDRGTDALVGWATTTATDDEALRHMILGGAQRRIADHVRLTVMDSSIADPAARGWQRVGAGRCKNGFCDMLIARGAVYTARTADFAAHDHCQCGAVPAWSGLSQPVRPFAPSERTISKADRARLLDWLASHPNAG